MDKTPPCAPNTDVSLVFASDDLGKWLSCCIFDDASGDKLHIPLGQNAGWSYFLPKEIFFIFALATSILALLIMSIYFKFWYFPVFTNTSTIGVLLIVAAFNVMLFTTTVQLRREWIQRIVEEKHADFVRMSARLSLKRGTFAEPDAKAHLGL